MADQEPSGKTMAGLNVSTVAEGERWFKFLVYGVPGVGKTRIAGSSFEVESFRPVLFIDLEGGTESIRELYPKIEVVRVKTIYDKGGRVKKSAWTQLRDLYEELKKGGHDYQTVVIDNVTEAYQISLQDVMQKLTAENPDRDPDVPSQREWGKATAQMRRFIRQMRDLPMHVIMTAHELAKEDDNGTVRHITPSLPGKLAMEASGFFDEVFYLYTKSEKGEDNKPITTRKIQTQPVGKYIAKDRSGKLPLVVSDPTIKSLYDQMGV